MGKRGVFPRLVGAGRRCVLRPDRGARSTLALAGVLSFMVPLANGIGTGAWLWVSAAAGWWGVFWVDAGFLVSAVILIWIARRLRPLSTDVSSNDTTTKPEHAPTEIPASLELTPA